MKNETPKDEILGEILWTDIQVSQFMQVSISFIRKDRALPLPLIPHIRVGGAVRYIPSTMRQFILDSSVPSVPSSQAAAVATAAPTDAPAVKRKPGRPAGVPDKNPAPKRGPGRPRKVQMEPGQWLKTQPWMKGEKK